MQKPPAHPFTIDITYDKRLRTNFSWLIRQRKGVGRQALTTYATFEEARQAGKAVLDEMIAARQYEALQSAAAELHPSAGQEGHERETSGACAL